MFEARNHSILGFSLSAGGGYKVQEGASISYREKVFIRYNAKFSEK